jgi:nucleotide sugar dehydrogenase
MVMVATPSLPNGFYDHSQVDRVVDALKKIGSVQRKQLVICCTVTPGYTRTVRKRLGGLGYYVSYSPEFIAQGNIINGQLYPDMVLIGSEDEDFSGSGQILANVYGIWCVKKGPINIMSSLSAEICKIALNCFVTTKIAYANMVGDLANAVGANHEAILKAIGDDTRIGPKYLRFGHGFGGPCFPRDNRAFAKYCRENKVVPFISEATDKSNRKHLDYFTQFFKRCLNKKEIHGFDAGYKPGSPIIEESQALLMAVRMARAGYKIGICGHDEAKRRVKKLYGKLFLYD